MITVVGVILAAQSNIVDSTYEIDNISIFTNLKTLLDINSACLFFSLTALKRSLRCETNNSNSSMVFSSSLARLLSRGLKTPEDRKFDDLYHVADLEGMGTKNRTTGVDSKSGSFFNDQARSLGDSAQPNP